jgi:hypothetical protein
MMFFGLKSAGWRGFGKPEWFQVVNRAAPYGIRRRGGQWALLEGLRTGYFHGQ